MSARKLNRNSRDSGDSQKWLEWLAFAAIVLACLAAFANSFSGAFILDDVDSIVNNQSIRQLWPIGPVLHPPSGYGITVEGRPMVNLSLAINYAISEKAPSSYHAVNLLIHMLAALTLFAVLRTTLQRVFSQPDSPLNSAGSSPNPSSKSPAASSFKPLAASHPWFSRYRAVFLGLAITLLWAVHPLQTESVTYIVQRAESMVALFYLLVLYCVIRGDAAADSRRWRWYVAAVACSFVGMATKEVMATAPLLVLLYDRTFLAGSFRAALKKRWPVYLGLAASWGLLAAIAIPAAGRGGTAGLAAKFSSLEYARTQPGVVLHYLRLCFWPWPLVLDYGWPVADTWQRIVPPAIVIGLLIGLSVWALCRRPKLGFLGAWFFLLLAPSSSVYPLNDIAFEHRMYLALASVVTLAVLTADWLWRRYADRIAPAGSRRWAIPLAAVLLATAALAAVTCRRNMDYVSDERMYRSTLAHAPNNARAILNVAALTSQTGDWPGTLELINRAIAADPTFPISWLQRGIVHREMGQLDQAMQDFNRAIELEREFPAAYNERADMFLRRGDHPAALADCNKAIGQAPQIGLFYHTRAEVYFAMKQYDRAQDDLKLAREHGARIDQGFLRKLQQAAERKPPALRGAE